MNQDVESRMSVTSSSALDESGDEESKDSKLPSLVEHIQRQSEER